MDTQLKNRGLLPLPVDDRDLSTSKVFGSIAKAALTTEDFLIVPPLEIMNQDINYDSDMCAGYALAALSEAQDGVTEVPEYTFAKAKQILVKKLGDNPSPQAISSIINTFGLNLRDIMNAGVTYGFLERDHDPFKCDTTDRPERSYIGDYRNWPEDLDSLAWEHAKNSYLAVDGPYDRFDNYRACLLANRDNRQGIITGANWRASWSNSPGGVVDTSTYNSNEPGSGHAFAVIGQATTEKGLCLVAQMSDGPQFGDHGLFYFTRAVVNTEFNFGEFHFSNIPRATAQIHTDFNFTVNSTAWQKFWGVAVYFINNYF